ncbi:MAG TPA: zf-HC2 domain-containing protein [Blastocatellia bacterium]|nr:zf-HC2 domain-containing protein [Blastocatellia bacterium]
MMNCRNAEQLIPLYVAADLETAEMQQVTAHLETCHSCRDLAAAFQSSQSSLRALSLPAFDETMMIAMRSAVQREISPTDSRPSIADWLLPLWHWKGAVAAAAAVALLVSGIVLWRRDTENKNIPIAAETNAPGVSAPHIETLQQSPRAQTVIQPRMGRKNKAQGGVSVSERNPGNSATSPPSPVRATDVDNQIAAAAIAPSGTSDDAMHLPRVNTLSSILPPVPQAENMTQSLEKSTPEPEMLRMEIQTADPNIKIIWLTPKEPTRTNPATDTK